MLCLYFKAMESYPEHIFSYEFKIILFSVNLADLLSPDIYIVLSAQKTMTATYALTIPLSLKLSSLLTFQEMFHNCWPIEHAVGFQQSPEQSDRCNGSQAQKS